MAAQHYRVKIPVSLPRASWIPTLDRVDTEQASTRVLIVVPAYNESRSLGEVVDRIRAALENVDVLVVDDGSLDSTAEVAEGRGTLVAQLPFNLGVGGAMRTGYRYALRHGYDAVVQIDADGQHDPSEIPQLLRQLTHCDIAIGSRFAAGTEYEVGRIRRLAMRGLARVVSGLAHQRLTDVTSGFRATNLRAIRLFASHYPAEYLGDTVESLVIAVRKGYKVVEVPVRMRQRSHGRGSQSTIRSSLYLVRAIAALTLALVRRWPEQAVIMERQ